MGNSLRTIGAATINGRFSRMSGISAARRPEGRPASRSRRGGRAYAIVVPCLLRAEAWRNVAKLPELLSS